MIWYDNKNGLPAPGRRVLVYIPQYEEVCVAFRDDRGFWKHDDGARFQDHEVSHWMPLPERP